MVIWTSVPQVEQSTEQVITRSQGLSRSARRWITCALLVCLGLVLAGAVRKEKGGPQENPFDDGSEGIIDEQSDETTSNDSVNQTGTVQVSEISPRDHDQDMVGDETPQIPLVTLSGKALNFSNNIEHNCPNWSTTFKRTFVTKCGYLVETFSEWARKSEKRKPVGYICRDEKDCHGLGDRLAGILGAFASGINARRPLKISWYGLDELFQSCVFTSHSAGQWHKDVHAVATGCIHHTRSACSTILNEARTCYSSNVWYENLDRGCLTDAMCNLGRAAFPDTLNTANLYGCTMRALLEPRPKLLNTVVRFNVPGKRITRMALKDAQNLMAKYYVIGIHFRVGDYASFIAPSSREISASQHNYLLPFQCAETIQSHLEQRPFNVTQVRVVKSKGMAYNRDVHDDEYKVNGRPVRWFLASDSTAVREMAAQLYGDKLFMIETRPVHIAFVTQNARTVLAHTFAEWYLLGLSDTLIINRIGGPSLYRGRMSSFSKTAWVYQLKTIVYDAGTCRKRPIILDGTWKAPPPTCGAPHTFHQRLDQPHLSPLDRIFGNRTFPQVWINRGIPSVFDPALVPPPVPLEESFPDEESIEESEDPN